MWPLLPSIDCRGFLRVLCVASLCTSLNFTRAFTCSFKHAFHDGFIWDHPLVWLCIDWPITQLTGGVEQRYSLLVNKPLYRTRCRQFIHVQYADLLHIFVLTYILYLVAWMQTFQDVIGLKWNGRLIDLVICRINCVPNNPRDGTTTIR